MSQTDRERDLIVPRLARMRIWAFRVPIDRPVFTSFGTMNSRTAVMVGVEDEHGTVGWGEAWCNFPDCGAEHRVNLLSTVIAPLVLDRSWSSPMAMFSELSGRTRVLAIQAGEPGPLAQCISAVDIAIWDLVARHRQVTLRSLLGERSVSRVPIYASGINPSGAMEAIERARAQGFSAFKVKVGFGEEHDTALVRGLCAELGPGEELMLDANQAWDVGVARRMIRALDDLPITWLEEPVRADVALEDWQLLGREARFPIAAGENIGSMAGFRRVIEAGCLGVIQPDICKWGGLSMCRTVAADVQASGARYCPHYLGGGLGLVASAHLLAAVGGTGMLEVDSNDNPLRTLMAQPFPQMAGGAMQLSNEPGLGVAPDFAELGKWQIMQEERTASS
ncbi:mandelate racemase/muconate lactonizing enzyme family protein [Amorphus sp. 3PC139-8]|uniref:mandelate racemase/muconate lactonizing enzyme family protein n=1 Tax=Amorphus sp. 3PC139-8 TaxID=2735676 RepID=UPI00345C672C